MKAALYELTTLPDELIDIIGTYYYSKAIVTLTRNIGFYYRGIEFYIRDMRLIARFDGQWEVDVCGASIVNGYGDRLTYNDLYGITHVVDIACGAWDIDNPTEYAWRKSHIGMFDSANRKHDIAFALRFHIKFEDTSIIICDSKGGLVVKQHMPCCVEGKPKIRDFGDSLVIVDNCKYILIDPYGFRCDEMFQKTMEKLIDYPLGRNPNYAWYSIFCH